MCSAIAVAHLLDGWGVRMHDAGARDHDWHRLLRVFGAIMTWFVVGGMLWRQDGHGRRAWPLVLSAGLSGLIAEVLKMVIRRGRPGADFEGYVLLPFEGAWWNTADLGMPSSHAAVAFGAAFALWRLFPRIGVIGMGLAVGCAATRVIDRAHFISDVIAAAGLAWVVVGVLWWRKRT